MGVWRSFGQYNVEKLNQCPKRQQAKQHAEHAQAAAHPLSRLSAVAQARQRADEIPGGLPGVAVPGRQALERGVRVLARVGREVALVAPLSSPAGLLSNAAEDRLSFPVPPRVVPCLITLRKRIMGQYQNLPFREESFPALSSRSGLGVCIWAKIFRDTFGTLSSVCK